MSPETKPAAPAPAPALFERHHEPVAPRHLFVRRVGRAFLVAAVLIAVSLAIGMAGFAVFEKMGAVDAFVNAAMLLSGMGPMKTDDLSTSGKLFAGTYALYCGLVVIITTGVLLAPTAHRLLHVFHARNGRE